MQQITKKTTAQKLGMTQDDYQAMLFGAYARWCESLTINAREFQKVLANSAINEWYLMEYAKHEAGFHEITDCYVSSCTVHDMQVCYNNCTYKMFNIRPTALLQCIKKTRTVSYLKVHGVKIPSLTFNQN